MTLIRLEVPVTTCKTEIHVVDLYLPHKDELKKHLEDNSETDWFRKNSVSSVPDSRPEFNINHLEEIKILEEKWLG